MDKRFGTHKQGTIFLTRLLLDFPDLINGVSLLIYFKLSIGCIAQSYISGVKPICLTFLFAIRIIFSEFGRKLPSHVTEPKYIQSLLTLVLNF